MHNFGTCKKNAAAQWRFPIKKLVLPELANTKFVGGYLCTQWYLIIITVHITSRGGGGEASIFPSIFFDFTTKIAIFHGETKKHSQEVFTCLCSQFTDMVTWSQRHRLLIIWTSSGSYPETGIYCTARVHAGPRSGLKLWRKHFLELETSGAQFAA